MSDQEDSNTPVTAAVDPESPELHAWFRQEQLRLSGPPIDSGDLGRAS